MDSWVGKIHWRRDRPPTPVLLGFPYGSAGKESTCSVGDLGLISGMGRSPREGKGCPLHYSCLENSKDRGPWQTIVHGVTKSWTQLSNFHTLTHLINIILGFPVGSAGKESTCSVGDLGLIPGLGKSPGEGNGYPLQYSGLENSMGSQRVGHDEGN